MMRCFDCANRSEGWNKEKTRYCDWCTVTGQRIDLHELHEDCPTFEEWVDDCEGGIVNECLVRRTHTKLFRPMRED